MSCENSPVKLKDKQPPLTPPQRRTHGPQQTPHPKGKGGPGTQQHSEAKVFASHPHQSPKARPEPPRQKGSPHPRNGTRSQPPPRENQTPTTSCCTPASRLKILFFYDAEGGRSQWYERTEPGCRTTAFTSKNDLQLAPPTSKNNLQLAPPHQRITCN